MEHLYLDLEKGHLNTTKLVKRPVEVHGENGKTFMRMQWVSAEDGKVAFTPRSKAQAPVNIKPHKIPLGLKHTDHNLPKEEVNKRHGYTGTLELNKLTEGVPLVEARKKDIETAKKLIQQFPFTKNQASKINPAEHVTNIFKNMTEEGLEHVFSDPKGKYTAKLTQLSVWGNKKHGHLECSIGLEWEDKKGNYMGGTERTVWRDSEGHLHVYNELTQIEKKYQGKGVAENEQARSEQLWRYLSDGHPVHMSLEANISIGVYAWALKGYDFYGEEELQQAKDELGTFLEKNGMNTNKVLKECGYNNMNDLSHSWQFAALDDGKTYVLSDLAQHENEDVSKKASGNLGKAFMLGGKEYWNAEKILNGGTEHEQIAEIHKKHVKEKKKAQKRKKGA